MNLTEKKIEYQVDDYGELFKWMGAINGKFLVNAVYVDEFKTEYPDAVQVDTIKEV
jgi:hypothetical protein